MIRRCAHRAARRHRRRASASTSSARSTSSDRCSRRSGWRSCSRPRRRRLRRGGVAVPGRGRDHRRLRARAPGGHGGKERVGAREGFLVVCAAVARWSRVFGALPYVLAEPQLPTRSTRCSSRCPASRPPAPASSRTSTGLPRSMLMWRQFTAWLGGLGIIVLFLAVLPRITSPAARRCSRRRRPGPSSASSRRSARPRGGSSSSTSRSPRLEILVLASLGWIGRRRPHDPLPGGRALVRDRRHRRASRPRRGRSSPSRPRPSGRSSSSWWSPARTSRCFTPVSSLRRPRPSLRDEEFRVYLRAARARVGGPRRRAHRHDVLAGGEAVRHADLQHGVDDDHDRLRQHRLQPWTSLTSLLLFGLLLVSASAGSTSGSIKLVRHVVDRQDAQARDPTTPCTRSSSRRCGSTARSSTSARCARSSSSSSCSSAPAPRAPP